MAKIVLSYRREDTGHVTDRIHEKLEDHFGIGNVFMDIDSMPVGVDFRDHLRNVLKSCDVLIAVVGPNWLKLDNSGRSGLHDKSDFVRMEIAAALENRVTVVPVLIESTQMPAPEQLPEDMRGFAFRHAARIDRGINFRGNMQRLITAVERLLDEKRTPIDPPVPPQVDEPAISPNSAAIPAEEPEPSVDTSPVDAGIARTDEVVVPVPQERPEDAGHESPPVNVETVPAKTPAVLVQRVAKPVVIAASLLVPIFAIWFASSGPPAPVAAGNDPLAGTWCGADGSELSTPSKITKYSDGSYVADFYAITAVKPKGNTDFVSDDNSLRLALKQTDKDTLEGTKFRSTGDEDVKFVRCR